MSLNYDFLSKISGALGFTCFHPGSGEVLVGEVVHMSMKQRGTKVCQRGTKKNSTRDQGNSTRDQGVPGIFFIDGDTFLYLSLNISIKTCFFFNVGQLVPWFFKQTPRTCNDFKILLSM